MFGGDPGKGAAVGDVSGAVRAGDRDLEAGANVVWCS